jgi:hypothetical protein
MQNCPAPAPKLRASFKAPNVLQKAYIFSQCRSNLNDLGGIAYRQLAGPMANSIIARAAALSDDDANGIIDEGRNVENLLI